MSDRNKSFDTIEASPVDLSHDALNPIPTDTGSTGAGSTAQAQNRRPAGPQPIYIVAIIGLLIMSLTFILLQNQRRANDTNANQHSAATKAATHTDTSVDQDPFNQAQTAAQRRQAQDLLAGILEKQKALESQQVALWAGANYLDALSKAAEGDEFYRRGQFEAALRQYQRSLEQLTAIEAHYGPFIKDTLADAVEAINTASKAEDESIAKTRIALELLLQIQPDNESAHKAVKRLDQLSQVLKLLTTAEQNFASGKLDEALGAYQKAIKLDPEHPQASAGLAQTQAKIKTRQFQSALNKGFADLARSDYAGATRAFRQALIIEPHSEVATQALIQAQTELDQIQIKQLLLSAGNDEQQERWSQALEAYNKVLAIDSSTVSASVGKIRSQTRAKLDSDLTSFIEAPLRLASPGVYQQARQLLNDAKGIQPGGSRLAEQVRQLEQALVLAATPQTLTLISDNATLVTILRVGKLGQFNTTTIDLKPGKYVAEGIRQGYRDVRVEFIVDGKGSASPIQIACQEAI